MGHSSSSCSSLEVKSSCSRTVATNNAPPLVFHPVHGENIRLSEDGRCAHRVRSYCHGIVFSSRPVAIGERIVVRLVQVSDQWSGVVRLGFTSIDPRLHINGLPKYSCPDLTCRPGFWAKAMSDRFAEPGGELFFHVTAGGDMHLGLNGVDRGVFISGVDTSRPLWALIDVYGNATTLRIVRPACGADRQRPAAVQQLPAVPQMASSARDRASVQVGDEPAGCGRLLPMPLLAGTHAGNVTVGPCRSRASRPETGGGGGYVFTERPLAVGERLSLQIFCRPADSTSAAAGLTLGLTSCDPRSLAPAELPAEPALLADRAEYWPMVTDVVAAPRPSERLDVQLAADGAVRCWRGRQPPRTLMHVDATLPLWPLLALTGAVSGLRVLGVSRDEAVAPHARLAANTVRLPPLPPEPAPATLVPPGRPEPTPAPLGRPEPTAATLVPPGRPEPTAATLVPPGKPEPTAGTAVARQPHGSVDVSVARGEPSADAAVVREEPSNGGGSAPYTSSDCSICLDRACDSALYACGHVCLCYTCAVQWRARGTGLCPMCNAPIRDVIQLYHS